MAVAGSCHYLRRLAAKFPPPIIPDEGPSLEQLVREKENSLKEAAGKNEDLDKEVAGLRAKVNRLEKDVDISSKDRYAFVRENCILQNKLGEFNSWPEFRVEFDELATQYEAMKRQRAREHISEDQILHIAKEAKLELAVAKRAEAMSNIAHSEDLKVVKQERDEAREKHQALLDTTTAAAAALQGENTRLTLALRSKTSLLFKKTSECERIQYLIKKRSDHSASKLKSAASTILALKEDKQNADERIAELEGEVEEANEEAEQMKDMYMALAFPDEGEEEDDEDEDEDGDGEEEDEDREDEEDGEDEDGEDEDGEYEEDGEDEE